MYQALYRKYRPRTFSEVSGQPHITVTLKNQLESGRISHAYLFTGSRGTGKTSCAKILAKAVNCLSPEGGDPCNRCEICHGIDDGSVLDILEIDAASNNGVENIRDLRERAVFTPAKAKYRVFIIDEVHMLSTGAFNALLKTLEEPPAHVVFILATTEVHKLPATILSRCQRFDFRRIDPDEIAARLQFVAGKEQFTLEPDAAALIASLADGGMRDALSILDLCAAAGETITEQTVAEVCGMAGREYLFELSGALRHQEADRALELINRLHSGSVDMQRLCEELISHYRNLMILKTVRDPKGLIVCPPAEYEQLKSRAAEYELETILYALRLLQETLDRMGKGNRRAELEMALIRLCSPELCDRKEALLERIARLERSMKTGTLPAGVPPASPAEPSPTEEASAPRETAVEPEIRAEEKPHPISRETPAEAAPPSGGGGEQALSCWPEILAVLAKTCPLIHGVLQGSSAYVKGDLLLIDSKNSQFRDLVKGESSPYKDHIRRAAEEVTGRVFRLGPYRKSETKVKEADPFSAFLQKIDDLGITE